MTLYGSLYSGLSGQTAQSAAVSMSADNIVNVNTVGYKATNPFFSTLTTQSVGSNQYSSGGVNVASVMTVNQQGLLQSTGQNTDLSISGNGFFIVNTEPDLSGNFYFTRSGSFSNDSVGNLKNTAGYYLCGWPLDSSGRIPGEAGNINNVSSALLASLQVVNVQSISGSASQTTDVKLGMNLNSSQALLKGTGDTISFPKTSINSGISSTQVILPDSSAGFELNTGDTFSLTPSDPGIAYSFVYGGFVNSQNLATTPAFGASTSTDTFSTGSTAGDGFTITTIVAGNTITYTYSYVSTSPTASAGQFNNLKTLADAINLNPGLSARISGNTLYIANKEDANNALTIANNNVNGTSNFATNLGLSSLAAAGGGIQRYATLGDLYGKINAQAGLSAVLQNALSSSSLNFYSTDPLGTLTVGAVGSGVAPATVSTQASIFAQLGINPPATDTYLASYDASDSNKNMAGGKVAAQFSRNIRVYDAFGTPQDLQASFGKVNDNVWSVELYALNTSSIISSRTDGQIANGTITFNGDGSLRAVSSSLSVPVDIIWADQSIPSAISFNWGTAGDVVGTIGATQIGDVDGLRQLDQAFYVDYVSQNGISAGLLEGTEVDAYGNIIALFNNGTSRKIFRAPLATFASPNNLQVVSGNAYAQTTDSGDYNLVTAGTGGAGDIVPGTLEQSNVDLANELTKMVIAQRGYQASSKVIKTVNEMLEELNRIF